MPTTSIIPQIKEQLQLPLPGQEAQYKMATSTRMPYKKNQFQKALE